MTPPMPHQCQWHDADVIPVIVDADFVAAHPEAVLADVRWYLDGRDGRESYEAGHLPGAVWVDLDRQLAAHDLAPTEGRHPLPSPRDFAAAMTELGIGDDTIVVAYDDTGGLTAGRLVVMLRMLGRDAALLDGGLAAWPGPVQTGTGSKAASAGAGTTRIVPFTARPWPVDRLASADETAAAAGRQGAVVLDARSAERFSGAVAQIDPRPGHVPGARNAPWAAVLGPHGRVRHPDELLEHYRRLGIDTVAAGIDTVAAGADTVAAGADSGARSATDTIAYCGSGVSACMNVIAMEHAGLTPARLYVASWSGWSADPDRPAALGE